MRDEGAHWESPAAKSLWRLARLRPETWGSPVSLAKVPASGKCSQVRVEGDVLSWGGNQETAQVSRQRVWHQMEASGLLLQPWTSLVYLPEKWNRSECVHS